VTRLRRIPGVQGAIKFIYRIANRHTATVNRIQILVLTTAPKALVSGPYLLKNKNGSRLLRAAGLTVGESLLAFPIQNMRHPYPRRMPSHLRPTLTGRRRTITTCLNHSHKDLPLRPPGNTIPESITIHPTA
jgi:hypothetical protein